MRPDSQANATDAKKTPVAVSLTQMVLKAKNSSLFLLAGIYVAMIESVIPDRPKFDKFKDHIQLAVKFVVEGQGLHTEWYNTKGFIRFSELSEPDQQSGKYENIDGYAVDSATGFRLEDADRTEQALDILRKLAYDAGYSEDENFTPSDLVGCTVGIRLAPDNRKIIHVRNSMPEEAVATANTTDVENDVM